MNKKIEVMESSLLKWSSSEVSINNIQIYYTRTGGEKPPVILLHGGMDNGLCWSRVALTLQKDFDVIMPDARLHGKSSSQGIEFSTQLLVDDVVALINRLNLPPVWVVGHSMGGRTAAILASQHSELIKGIVLEEPALDFEKSRSFKLMVMKWILPFMISRMKKKTKEGIRKLGNRINKGWNEIDLETWVNAQYEFSRNDSDIFSGFSQKYYWKDIFESISKPVLLFIAE